MADILSFLRRMRMRMMDGRGVGSMEYGVWSFEAEREDALYVKKERDGWMGGDEKSL